jgi:hypothetical protein
MVVTQATFFGSSRGIRLNITGFLATHTFIAVNSNNAGTPYGVELTGQTSNVTFVGGTISGSTNSVLVNSSETGGFFTFAGTQLTAGVTAAGVAADPVIRYIGCQVEGPALISTAVGTSITPILYQGHYVRLVASSGGAGTVTVNAPSPLPFGTTDQIWTFAFVNGSGGAVTWSLNAVFKTSASIPTTDGHTILVAFAWDNVAGKLRELSRADSTT